VKLYPVAPLLDGGMHINLPTIDLCQAVPHQNIPAPVKHRKFHHRPVEDIIRAILLDSARFYNPDRRHHRREYTSTGTKLIYCTAGRPQQRDRIQSFLWDSDWRHGPESPGAGLSVFECSFCSPVPSSSEEQFTWKCEHSNNFRLSPTSEIQELISPLDYTQSLSVLPTDHDLISFGSSQSSLQHRHVSTLPCFDDVENEPSNLTMESPKSLLKFQVNSSNPDNSRGYLQESLDSERWKRSRGQRHSHLSGSSSSSSDSSSDIPLTHKVRHQYSPLLEYCVSSLLQLMIDHVLDMSTFQLVSYNHFVFLYSNDLCIVVLFLVDFKFLHAQ
jgi:hypothetical protein